MMKGFPHKKYRSFSKPIIVGMVPFNELPYKPLEEKREKKNYQRARTPDSQGRRRVHRATMPVSFASSVGRVPDKPV